MSNLSHYNAFLVARVKSLHKAQLEELAAAEGRTKSSMIRRLIVRAYRDQVRRRDIDEGH